MSASRKKDKKSPSYVPFTSRNKEWEMKFIQRKNPEKNIDGTTGMPDLGIKRWEMRFSYQSNTFLSVTFKKDAELYKIQIKDIDNVPECKDDTFIHAKLVNYLLKLNSEKKYDEASFKEFIINYFYGPLIDLADNKKNEGYLIASYPLDKNTNWIADAIKPILNSQDIQVDFFPNITDDDMRTAGITYEFCWLRDYIIPMGNDWQINLNQHTLSLYQTKHYSEAFDLRLQTYNDMHRLLKELGPLYNKHPKNYDFHISGSAANHGIDEANRREFVERCLSYNNINYNITHVLVDGGNIITARLENGQIYSFVNRMDILKTVCYQMQNMNDDNEYSQEVRAINKKYIKKTNHTNSDFYNEAIKQFKEFNLTAGHIKYAKHTIQTLFRTKVKSILVPDYHLDVVALLGPNQVMFVNDFEMTSTIAADNPSALNDQIADIAKEFHEATKDVYATMNDQFEKAGFTVVKVPAIIFTYNEEDKFLSDDDRAASQFLVKKKVSPLVMRTDFINGLVGDGKEGSFYVGLNCDDDLAIYRDAFKAITEPYMRNVFFIGEAKETEPLLKASGGLRCLSVRKRFYPGSFFTQAEPAISSTSTADENKNISNRSYFI